MINLFIQKGNELYQPVVESGIVWTTERKGTPSKLTFTIVKDVDVEYSEGSAVRMSVDGVNVFYGFIFSKKRNKNDRISIVAYDQLRYLKNKETYVYANKRADEVIRMIASDFNLQVGSLANTGYIIPQMIEDNQPLFDIINNALNETLTNKGKLYCLYDDFGKLTLKDIESMKLDLLIDKDTAQDFDYNSSIDSNTYNQVKLYHDDDKKGKREVYISKSTENINNWGVLQLSESIDDNVNGKAKADALLKLYNQVNRTFTVSKAFGDIRVRGGSSVIVRMNLGDINISQYMLVESVTHHFENGLHTMDLKLKGNKING